MYLANWGRVAFRFSFSTLEKLTAIVGAFVPMLARFFPEWKAPMEDLIWQIPLWGCGAFVAARVIAAPFLIHQQQEREIEKLRGRIAKPSLEVGFDGDSPECFEDHGTKQWRLYVVNKNLDKTARDVEVSIVSIAPAVPGFAISPLRRVRVPSVDGPSAIQKALMSQKHTGPQVAGVERNRFDLNGGAHRCVHFISWYKDKDTFKFETVGETNPPTQMPVQPYRVSLSVTALDTPVTLSDFDVIPGPDKSLRIEAVGLSAH